MTSTALLGSNITCELGAHRVLHNVSLKAESGQMVGIIGANGAGKSTLLRILAGLYSNHSGSVDLGGIPIGQLSDLERAKNVAFLPQNPDVHWDLTARQVVALGRIPHQRSFNWLDDPNDVDRTAIARAMAATQCHHFADRSIRSLSSGEQMRVHLARTFAVHARVILTDEPVNGLDPFHQIRCLKVLRNCASKDNCTVVTVLHDLDLAARFCDQLLLLHNGEVLASGNPAQVLSPPNLTKAYRIRPPADAQGHNHNIALWDCEDD